MLLQNLFGFSGKTKGQVICYKPFGSLGWDHRRGFFYHGGMAWPLDERFRIPENEAVLEFIERENPSAHSDVASFLVDLARDLPDVKWYCPDAHAYAYVALHTRNRRIFGLAYGMGALAFRTPPAQVAEAKAAGGTAEPGLSGDWIVFQGGNVWTIAASLKRWCKAAHDHVVGRLG